MRYLEKLFLALQAEAEGDVYTGSKSKAFRMTGASISWFTKLYSLLIQMGCVEQITVGNSGTPSVIRLIRAPTLDAYEKVEVEDRAKRLTEAPTRAILHSRLSAVEGRLPEFDIAGYLRSLEAKLADLQERVSELERKG